MSETDEESNEGTDSADRKGNQDQKEATHTENDDAPTDTSSEIRTDGGEVVTDSSPTVNQPGHPQTPTTPNSPAPDPPTDIDQSDDYHTSQPNQLPSDSPGDKSNSITTAKNSSDQKDLFSGEIPLDHVIEFYLETNPWNVSSRTVKAYRTHLGYLQDFSRQHDIQGLNRFRPQTLDEYQNYLHDHPNQQAKSTIKGYLSSLRKFLQYCERRGVFDHGFHKLVILPTISKYESRDERWLSRETAREVVSHLETYKPFTKEHVVWAILSETGIRQSTLHAFDLEDYHSSERYLEAVNRPETDTRLKNGARGERELSISQKTAEALDRYIEVNRDPVTDDHGRKPLLTTRNGRLAKNTIRQYVYAWSRPCALGKECPVGEDPDTCEPAQTNNAAFDCPESVSPHPVRRGYITHLRANGVPTEDVISERCDANPETIESWYDMSTESERREARREYVEDL